MTDLAQQAEERFWARVQKSDGCWEWTGSLHRNGYGQFSVGFKKVNPHRFAYQLLVGPISSHVRLDHTYHVKSCVNPEHLRPSTYKRNAENLTGAYANSKSGVRGVFPTRGGKWQVIVRHHGKGHYIGTFSDLREAEQAAIAARMSLFTDNDRDRSEVTCS